MLESVAMFLPEMVELQSERGIKQLILNHMCKIIVKYRVVIEGITIPGFKTVLGYYSLETMVVHSEDW